MEDDPVGYPEKFWLQLAELGLLGLTLALVGVYGVVSFGASLRTREIGIRLALGANRRAILRMVLRQGMGLALAGVRQGKSMLDLQLDHGFESGSGFRVAFNRHVGAAPSRAHDVECLYAQWFETPLGAMLALADDRGLALLEFVDRRGLEREIEVMQKKLKRPILPGAHRYLAQIRDELAAHRVRLVDTAAPGDEEVIALDPRHPDLRGHRELHH